MTTATVQSPSAPASVAGGSALRWKAYLAEAVLLGAFMVSACTFGVVLGHPDSPVHRTVSPDLARRAIMGLAMCGTLVALFHSPLGRYSGAQMNPAVTLSHLRLGRMTRTDALFYVVAQFTGAVAAVALMDVLLRDPLRHPAVHHVTTVPGPAGPWMAWAAEFAMTFVLMSVVLATNAHRRLVRFTSFFAGAMVALYITLAAPVSGMSMNPARTLGSAVSAWLWTALWVYFTAPVLGMLAAVEVRRLFTNAQTICGKFTHGADGDDGPCLARCDCLVHKKG